MEYRPRESPHWFLLLAEGREAGGGETQREYLSQRSDLSLVCSHRLSALLLGCQVANCIHPLSSNLPRTRLECASVAPISSFIPTAVKHSLCLSIGPTLLLVYLPIPQSPRASFLSLSNIASVPAWLHLLAIEACWASVGLVIQTTAINCHLRSCAQPCEDGSSHVSYFGYLLSSNFTIADFISIF